jgi:hypothetical protein
MPLGVSTTKNARRESQLIALVSVVLSPRTESCRDRHLATAGGRDVEQVDLSRACISSAGSPPRYRSGRCLWRMPFRPGPGELLACSMPPTE